jgi:LacI family transcriptional regulator
MAQSLGVSRSTVSDALRNSPRVNAATAKRVREFAASAGYRMNPLASALMSEIRRTHTTDFRGVLAAVAVDEPLRPKPGEAFINELARGAAERARELGFGLERFVVGADSLSMPRLHSILRARGIAGIVLLPAWGDPEFSQLDWSNYAGVYTDYLIEHPALHSVCLDHHRSMMSTLQRLRALGYRRPGLFLNLHQDERVQHRWEACFLAYQRHGPGIEAVPPLVVDEITPAKFKKWFRQHQPDVAIGHHSEAISWLRECGAKVPGTHGFFSLNLAMSHEPCAGLDQRPRLLGARAAEIVIAQLQRNDFGIPANASLTTLPAVWVDGCTLRGAG